MSSVKIKEAVLTQSTELSDLHRKNICFGFLSHLGKRLLSLVYKSIIISPNAFCFVAEDEGRVVFED